MTKSKAKILVVDDNSGIRAALGLLLPMHFAQVEQPKRRPDAAVVIDYQYLCLTLCHGNLLLTIDSKYK